MQLSLNRFAGLNAVERPLDEAEPSESTDEYDENGKCFASGASTLPLHQANLSRSLPSMHRRVATSCTGGPKAVHGVGALPLIPSAHCLPSRHTT